MQDKCSLNCNTYLLPILLLYYNLPTQGILVDPSVKRYPDAIRPSSDSSRATRLESQSSAIPRLLASAGRCWPSCHGGPFETWEVIAVQACDWGLRLHLHP